MGDGGPPPRGRAFCGVAPLCLFFRLCFGRLPLPTRRHGTPLAARQRPKGGLARCAARTTGSACAALLMWRSASVALGGSPFAAPRRARGRGDGQLRSRPHRKGGNGWWRPERGRGCPSWSRIAANVCAARGPAGGDLSRRSRFGARRSLAPLVVRPETRAGSRGRALRSASTALRAEDPSRSTNESGSRRPRASPPARGGLAAPRAVAGGLARARISRGRALRRPHPVRWRRPW